MKGDRIAYRNLRRHGWKYEMAFDYAVETPLRPAEAIETEFFTLRCDGWLLIRRGYCWDGPSGPTIDTPDTMRGSLVHDVIYQIMRMGHLAIESAKPIADTMLRELMIEDGATWGRADEFYWGVRLFGFTSARFDRMAALADPECEVEWAPTAPPARDVGGGFGFGGGFGTGSGVDGFGVNPAT